MARTSEPQGSLGKEAAKHWAGFRAEVPTVTRDQQQRELD